jgi:hypothetical protein
VVATAVHVMKNPLPHKFLVVVCKERVGRLKERSDGAGGRVTVVVHRLHGKPVPACGLEAAYVCRSDYGRDGRAPMPSR